MEFLPVFVLGFHSVVLETCVSFVLDSDASRASSSFVLDSDASGASSSFSSLSPSPSMRSSSLLELDRRVRPDLLGQLREHSITYNDMRVRDRYILRLVTFPAANAKEVRGLLRVDQSIYFCEDLHPINTQE